MWVRASQQFKTAFTWTAMLVVIPSVLSSALAAVIGVVVRFFVCGGEGPPDLSFFGGSMIGGLISFWPLIILIWLLCSVIWAGELVFAISIVARHKWLDPSIILTDHKRGILGGLGVGLVALGATGIANYFVIDKIYRCFA